MKNKKLLRLLIFGLLVALLVPFLTYAEEDVFKDITNSYAKNEIEILYKDGILNGMGDGVFNPKGKMDRAQLSAVLVRSLKLDVDKQNATKFTDVLQSSWYAGYVGALAKTNITTGTSASTFSPKENVNKQELAVFYIRALGLEEKAKDLGIEPKFTDNDNIAIWAKDHVGLASYLGLLTGTGELGGISKFNPLLEVDRELLAHTTYKLIYNKDYYHNMLALYKDPNKPRPTPIIDPIDPIRPEPTEPSKPKDPPADDNPEKISIENIVGKQVQFMGAYLISVEFNIKGDKDIKEVKVIINEGKENAMTLKQGKAESFDFYFDGMVLQIQTITLSIDNERIDLTSLVDWN